MSRKTQQGFEGTREQRFALRAALVQLHAASVSDQHIVDRVNQLIADDRVPGFPGSATRPISRPSVQRVRTAADHELIGFRTGTLGKLYNGLCHCEDLPSGLYDHTIRIHSAHEYAPLLAALQNQIGARDGPLDNNKLKSLEGTYHFYRAAWTSPGRQNFVRCILRMNWVGDALFYTEEQRFFDPVANLPIDENDTGIVLPFGMNVVLIGRGDERDLLKFFSLHDFDTFPDGYLQVHAFSGNFIAVYGKGPHPGFRVYARRVDPEKAETAFIMTDDMNPEILAKLTG